MWSITEWYTYTFVGPFAHTQNAVILEKNQETHSFFCVSSYALSPLSSLCFIVNVIEKLFLCFSIRKNRKHKQKSKLLFSVFSVMQQYYSDNIACSFTHTHYFRFVETVEFRCAFYERYTWMNISNKSNNIQMDDAMLWKLHSELRMRAFSPFRSVSHHFHTFDLPCFCRISVLEVKIHSENTNQTPY